MVCKPLAQKINLFQKILKIILPLEDISENHGGIEIKKEYEPISYKMISNKTDFLAFFQTDTFS